MDGSRPTSFWNTRVAETACPGLEDDVAVDVAVIGGGIAGATAATLLKLSGKQVALLKLSGERVARLEARRVGRQVTGESKRQDHLASSRTAAWSMGLRWHR